MRGKDAGSQVAVCKTKNYLPLAERETIVDSKNQSVWGALAAAGAMFVFGAFLAWDLPGLWFLPVSFAMSGVVAYLTYQPREVGRTIITTFREMTTGAMENAWEYGRLIMSMVDSAISLIAARWPTVLLVIVCSWWYPYLNFNHEIALYRNNVVHVILTPALLAALSVCMASVLILGEIVFVESFCDEFPWLKVWMTKWIGESHNAKGSHGDTLLYALVGVDCGEGKNERVRRYSHKLFATALIVVLATAIFSIPYSLYFVCRMIIHLAIIVFHGMVWCGRFTYRVFYRIHCAERVMIWVDGSVGGLLAILVASLVREESIGHAPILAKLSVVTLGSLFSVGIGLLVQMAIEHGYLKPPEEASVES
jgi:hypothetical protein